jgi:hypothetical protein
MVYYLRRKTRKARRQVAADGVAPSGAGGATYSADLILGVKNLAKEAGGFRNLKQLVEVLGR